MATLTQHLRQRLVLHSGHPSGAFGPFPIVKEYDGNATVAFPGVKIGASGISRPADLKVMHHWLNVSKWDVSVAFTGTSLGVEWPYPYAIDPALEFQLPTGRIATIAEDGLTVDFDETEPLTRAELYKGAGAGAYRRSQILWGPFETSNGTVPDTIYTRRTWLDIALVHGAWGHHNIHGEWMLRLDVDVAEEVNETAQGAEEEVSFGGSEGSPPEPTCSEGYTYREGSLEFDGVGIWRWYCDLPATDLTHNYNLLTDPDAAVDVGDLFDDAILCRAEEAIEANYGLSPTLTISITPAEYYTGWI